MSSQKLQPIRAIEVYPSDTVDIPNPSNLRASGTTTSTVSNKLVDSSASFKTPIIMPKDIVYNTTDKTCTTVKQVVDANTILLEDNIMASGEDYKIFHWEKAEGAVLRVGVGGTASFMTYGGDTVEYQNIADGEQFSAHYKRVLSTGLTDCDNIIAHF